MNIDRESFEYRTHLAVRERLLQAFVMILALTGCFAATFQLTFVDIVVI